LFDNAETEKLFFKNINIGVNLFKPLN